MKDKNSMFYWWPLVKDLPVPQPRTILVRHEGAFKGRLSYGPLEGDPDKPFLDMVEGVKKAAREIGYPIFIRSDEASNKHDWKNSCYVENEEQVYDHACNILEFTAMVMFGLSFYGVAVREFLDLDWRFKAYYGEMPVAAERRYFVRDGKVECWHPYWPSSAVEQPSVETWREQLRELQIPRAGEVELLAGYAETIWEVVGGYWSIDFCRHRNGTWHLTDMAMGEESYHWGTCSHAPPEMFEIYGDPDRKTEEQKDA